MQSKIWLCWVLNFNTESDWTSSNNCMYVCPEFFSLPLHICQKWICYRLPFLTIWKFFNTMLYRTIDKVSFLYTSEESVQVMKNNAFDRIGWFLLSTPGAICCCFPLLITRNIIPIFPWNLWQPKRESVQWIHVEELGDVKNTDLTQTGRWIERDPKETWKIQTLTLGMRGLSL